ncbi:hypothetical protein [Streptomyces sp. NPDC005907]|uniref:hypothetical protein n=1 Tax=Streptomyces sp. NPDC005907 TaxID=3154571 RepID=UPI0033D53745
MMTNPTRTHGVRCALMASLLALAVVGCDSGGGAEKPTPSVRAQQLCGGKAVTEEAAKALEEIFGTDRFEATNKKTTVAAAAAELSRPAVSTTIGRGEICRIFPPVGSRTEVDDLRVRWYMYDTGPDQDHHPKYTLFPMGEQAGGATDGGYLYFECRANGHATVTPNHISVNVENPDPFEEPEGDPRKLKRAYATVAHSFSLAMAKELRCADDGGLKAAPSL